MIRQTSIQAYDHIRQNGLLSKKRLEVYAWLFEHGPATAGRLAAGIHGNRNNTATRLTELRNMGVVQEVGEATEITGETVILWDVTAALPTPFKRSSSSRIEALIHENNKLKELLAQALDVIEGKKTKVKKKTFPVRKNAKQQSLF